MSQRRRPRSTRSNTEELDQCHTRIKPMPKSQTFSNGQKYIHSSATQYRTEEPPCTDKLVSQQHMKLRGNEKSYPDNPLQATRSGKAKVWKKSPSAACCMSEKPAKGLSDLRNGVDDGAAASGMAALQCGYLQSKQVPLNDRSPSKSLTCFPRDRQSLEKLFLDLELVELTKEDEDSASDLSDSERLPIPPSPLSPPELNLPAEEISPGYFRHEVQAKGKDYDYPDFLPPPYNAWNLSEVSSILNKEGKTKAAPSAFLERYVDRLLQLEWLQSQTIQAEKAKTNKPRPQTASGMCRNGKSRPWHSPSPSKQNSDSYFRMAVTPERSPHQKYSSCQISDLSCRSPTKAPGLVNVPTPSFRHSPGARVAPKKAPVMNAQQNKDFSSTKMLSTGNLRPSRQSPTSVSSPGTLTQAKPCKLKKANGQPIAGSGADYSRKNRNGKTSASACCKMKH